MNNKNIGEWSSIETNEGKTPLLTTKGSFPTNGEQPLFQLENPRTGFNPTELIYDLAFGNLVDEKGKVTATVQKREALSFTGQYKTVLVVDPDGRTIANITVQQS